MAKKEKVVAIDGPAGSGKSTVAKRVARSLKLPYIDTGAMYRALTWSALKKGLKWSDTTGLINLAKRASIELGPLGKVKQTVWIDGADVTREIRSPALTRHIHHVASEPGVRQQMVKLQRRLGQSRGGVLEGRDIGTVVFPKADHKFFLDAKPEVRAERRYLELKTKGIKGSLKRTAKDLNERDTRDRNRAHGRLKRAKDAVYLDTSDMTIDQVVRRVLMAVRLTRRARG